MALFIVNEERTDSDVGQGKAASALLLAFAFTLMMVDGYDIFNVSFLMPLIAKDLALSHMSVGQVFAAGLAGSMLGGMILGPVADRIGRRPVLMLSLVVAGLATMLCSTATTFGALAGYRLVTGFALGGVLTAVIPLVGEHFPKERRSMAVTLMFVGFPSGAVVGGALTSTFIHHGWQTLFVGAGAITLLVLPLAMFLKPSMIDERTTAKPDGPKGTIASVRALVAEGRLGVTICVMLSAFCMLLVLYLLNSWVPMIASSAGMPPDAAALTVVILNLGGITGAIGSTVAVRRWGVFKAPSAMVAVGAVAIAALGFLNPTGVGFVVCLAMVGLLAIGGNQNAPAMAVEVYPQRIRATGAGWQFAAGRLGAIAGPMIGGQLLAWHVQPETLYMLIAVPALLAAVAFALIGYLKPKQVD